MKSPPMGLLWALVRGGLRSIWHPATGPTSWFRGPDAEGDYLLFDLAAPAEHSLRKGQAEWQNALARVVVSGPRRPMALPDPSAPARLVPYSPIASVQRYRELRFSGSELGWKINGMQFDPQRTDYSPVLDTAREWTLVSEVDHHPFHMHVNPFLVTSIKNRMNQELPDRPCLERHHLASGRAHDHSSDPVPALRRQNRAALSQARP